MKLLKVSFFILGTLIFSINHFAQCQTKISFGKEAKLEKENFVSYYESNEKILGISGTYHTSLKPYEFTGSKKLIINEYDEKLSLKASNSIKLPEMEPIYVVPATNKIWLIGVIKEAGFFIVRLFTISESGKLDFQKDLDKAKIISRTPAYYISVSDNKSKILLYRSCSANEYDNHPHAQESIKLFVYDSDFKLLGSKEQTFPYSDVNFEVDNWTISNSGISYLLAHSDPAKTTSKTLLISYDPFKDALTETWINKDNKIYPIREKLSFDANENLLISGFFSKYSQKKYNPIGFMAGTFTVKFDKNSNLEQYNKIQYFSDELSSKIGTYSGTLIIVPDDMKKDGIKKDDIKKETYIINIIDIINVSGETYMISENQGYEYEKYYYKDIFIFKFNEIGNLVFVKVLNKEQYAKYEQRKHCSVAYYASGETFNVLFLGPKEGKKKAITFNNLALYNYSISENGESGMSTLIENCDGYNMTTKNPLIINNSIIFSFESNKMQKTGSWKIN